MRKRPGTHVNSSEESDRDAIRALYEVWLKSFFEGDLDGHLDCYTDDALWMNPNSWSDFTKEDSRPFYQEWLDEEILDPDRWVVSLDEIMILGDWAVVRLTTRGSGIVKKSGIVEKHGSRHLGVLRRQPDGTWRIVRDIFNNPPL